MLIIEIEEKIQLFRKKQVDKLELFVSLHIDARLGKFYFIRYIFEQKKF